MDRGWGQLGETGHRCSSHLVADEHGVIHVFVILMLAVLLSLGAVGTRSAQVELQIAANDLMSKQALDAAEAGLDHAFALLKKKDAGGFNAASNGFDDELSAGGTGGKIAALGWVEVLDDGNSYRCNRTSSMSSPDGYCVRIVDNTDESAGFNDPTKDRDSSVTLLSRGRVGKAERVVQARLTTNPVYPCVLCSNLDFPIAAADLTIVGGIETDSYNSAVGYGSSSGGSQGHLISNGSVTLDGVPLVLPIKVKGDVTASDTIVELLGVTVTGVETQFATPTEFNPVLPCGPPYPPNDGITGGLYTQATGLLVNVGVNEIIDLAPGEYCFSAIVLSGTSQIRVSGPTHIRLTAPSTILGAINTTGIPGDLRISSSLVQPLPFLPAVPGLVIGSVGGQANMVINAPNALVSFVGGFTDFYGQIVAGIMPTVGVMKYHYDIALRTPTIARSGWRELRNYPPS